MGMSLDMATQKKDDLVMSMAAAAKSGDVEQLAKACADFSDYVQAKVLNDYKELSASTSADTAVLAARGYDQLTAAETKYYEALADAMKSSDVKMALTNLEIAMPETVVDRVMRDVVQAHPLLDAITFENTMGAVKMVANAGGVATAAWGRLTDSKKAEINASLVEIDATHLKLISYIPVPKAMLDLGPVWLDAFIRAILGESIALGMEEGIINGDGNEAPIGMIRQVGASATITGGVYAEKTPIAVTSFDRQSYGSLLAQVSKNSENGRYRDFAEAIIICNPADYFTKVMPAMTVLSPAGTYIKDVFPYPTRVIKSTQVAEGKAIFGIADRYYMCLGLPKNGKIEYSDDVQFMDDNRVYLAKLYGNGLPMDNNAFLYLDISGLEELRVPVVTWTESVEAADGE